MTDLNDRIAKYLCKCPGAVSGNGGHNQTLSIAGALVHGFALNESEAMEFMRMYNARCEPPWRECDLLRKVREVIRLGSTKPHGYLLGNGSFPSPAAPRVEPKPDPLKEMQRLLDGFRCTEADLFDASPIKPSEDWTKDGPLVLQHLYHTGEKINIVTEYSIYENKSGEKKANPKGYGDTIDRDEAIADWTSIGTPESDAGGWMRMNPMDGHGVEDKNVTSFRFALFEFDKIPLDLQLSFLARFPLPVAAILTSGGKSVHAWVRVDAADLEDYKQTVSWIHDSISRYGIDKQNKNPSRLSRLPGAQRKIGASDDGRQRLLFLNPSPEQRSIL